MEASPSALPRGPLIVGVGASAGGLEAFTSLLHEMPENPGLAFVLVSHLAPNHESALPMLLGARTRLPVVQAVEGMRVEANRVHVIPPNVQMGIADDRLHLSRRPTDRSQYTPIDFFLRSLADSAQERAVAVILSGTASDGTAGIRDVKAAGGIVFVQTPETATYDGMPRAAIGTGVVDLVLSPADIAAELVRVARHVERPEGVAPETAPRELREEPFRRILSLLRGATGVDFARYKRATLERRLHRRMMLHKFDDLEQYHAFLRDSPQQVQALYRDLLIHVTRFFREPDSFEAVKSVVLPRILADRSDEQTIRIWVPGCSTGEEAYSIGIVVLEALREREHALPVQIFATDVSEAAIEHARAGIYAESLAADVGAERLERFFHRMAGGFRVTKALRDLCVFARQDLTREPPFSKLDLVVCRNVLIYMGAELQQRLMNVFHYALRPHGFLMLGYAETIGPHSDLFAVADKKHRIFEKKAAVSPVLGLPADRDAAVTPSDAPATSPGHGRQEQRRQVALEANRLVQDRFSPPGVIVDEDFQIVQYRGQTGTFLEPAPGEPSTSLFRMVREGLLHGLRSALNEARRTWTATRRPLRVRANGEWHDVELHVLPLGIPDHPHFLLLFDRVTRSPEPPVAASPKRRGSAPRARAVESQRFARLQKELTTSREYLQSIIQELEAANEELQSANEEILSANEELQSTNEELDTAKEELQSTNEELNTVNEELQSRNDELTRVNSDLVNLLGSVEIAIVIVDAGLRIRRFTPMAEKMLNLIPGDVGRPIQHIKPNIDLAELESLIERVISTVTPCEREVRDRAGHRLSLRIRPYKNLENRIDGAVLALFDTHAAAALVHGRDRALALGDAVVEMATDPVVVLDASGRVRRANAAFYRDFGRTSAEVDGRRLAELGPGLWSAPELAALLDGDLGMEGGGRSVELDHDARGTGRGRWRVAARRVAAEGSIEELVVVTFRRGAC